MTTWICWRCWPVALLVSLIVVCAQDVMRHPEGYVAEAAELPETGTITLDRGGTPTTISIDWDAPPEDCESKLYRWDGELLRCATTDRIGHVKLQRNHNMRALEMCQAEVTYLRGAQLLAAMNNEQRAKCREMGKVFDETEVICAGSLTPGEEK